MPRALDVVASTATRNTKRQEQKHVLEVNACNECRQRNAPVHMRSPSCFASRCRRSDGTMLPPPLSPPSGPLASAVASAPLTAVSDRPKVAAAWLLGAASTVCSRCCSARRLLFLLSLPSWPLLAGAAVALAAAVPAVAACPGPVALVNQSPEVDM